MRKQRKLDFNRQFAFGGGEMSLQRPTTGGEIMREGKATRVWGVNREADK